PAPKLASPHCCISSTDPRERGPWDSVSRMDDAEFADWYRDHYRRVYASVLVVSGDRGATADAVDEAFARAWERWSKVRVMESPAGWTFTVARNLVRRGAKRRTRERSVVQPVPVAPEIDVALWQTVQSLPPRERELVALRYVAGLTEAQIAT